MPKIRGLICGSLNGGQLVTDGRTLNAMERAGHFFRKDRAHPYVNTKDHPSWFMWKDRKYRIQYFDGCFSPFVVRLPDPSPLNTVQL